MTQSAQHVVLLDVHGMMALGCVWPRTVQPLPRLALATCVPLALVGICLAVGVWHLRSGRPVVAERSKWAAAAVAALTFTNAQSQALLAFVCRSLRSTGGVRVLSSDPSMPCGGAWYASFAAFAGVMACIYCVGYPLCTWRLLQRAAQGGRVPLWMQPLTTGMRPSACGLEVIEVVQRTLVVAGFVFATMPGSGSPTATLAALTAAALQLAAVYVLETRAPFTSQRARRASMVAHFFVTLCMLQLAGMPSHNSYSSPGAVWLTALCGVAAVAAAIACTPLGTASD